MSLPISFTDLDSLVQMLDSADTAMTTAGTLVLLYATGAVDIPNMRAGLMLGASVAVASSLSKIVVRNLRSGKVRDTGSSV